MSNKNLVYTVSLLVACTFGLSTLASADVATLPKSPREMMQKSVADMKAYPDVKVQLDHKLTDKDLKSKSETELSLMRNSIFAQAGAKFTDAWLKNYFTSREWYSAAKPNPKLITQVDRDNAKMILEFQKKHNLVAFVQKPSQVRVAAGHAKPEVKLNDAALRKAILGAKYCTLYNEDGLVGQLRFHHNNTVEFNQGYDFGYQDAYGAAYGTDSAYASGENAYASEGAYGVGAYGDAYSGTHSNPRVKWAIVRGHINYVSGGQRTTLYFAADSFKNHACFTSSAILF